MTSRECRSLWLMFMKRNEAQETHSQRTDNQEENKETEHKEHKRAQYDCASTHIFEVW